jgi:hypothetical protein
MRSHSSTLVVRIISSSARLATMLCPAPRLHRLFLCWAQCILACCCAIGTLSAGAPESSAVCLDWSALLAKSFGSAHSYLSTTAVFANTRILACTCMVRAQQRGRSLAESPFCSY